MTKRKTMWYIVFVMALFAVLFDRVHFTGSDFMGRICFSFPFYCTGYLLKDHVAHLVEMKATTRLFMLIGAIMVLIPIALWNTRGGILSYHFGKTIFAYYSTGFIGTFAVLCLVSFFKHLSYHIVTFISNGTLVILGTHIMIISYVDFVRTENAYFTAAICLLLTLPFIYLFNKYTPQLVGKK